MNIQAELQRRFRAALATLVADSRALDELTGMLKPAQDPKFGDYQANFAMPLAKQLGKSPREVAQDLIERTQLSDLCQTPEVAGPGFINLRLRDDWLAARSQAAALDPRVGVQPVVQPRTYIIDYSSPNVAKPMHVGHVRSTVIGGALDRLLRFLGHRVVSDNHLGDWGTQFGMVIYGYKHFVDADAYRAAPVAELARLYRLVSGLVGYYESREQLPRLEKQLAERQSALAQLKAAPPAAGDDKNAAKKHAAAVKKAEKNVVDAQEELAGCQGKIAGVERNPQMAALAQAHPTIGDAVLAETAKLHAGDVENLRLWNEFMPLCRAELHRIYDRMGVKFDEELGESFYHEHLGAVVEDFQRRGLATESEGATCVFLEGFDAPMIVRKRDGAFLYATSDLATIKYRIERWKPDAILYVVDHRQGDHFAKLFAAARLWGYGGVELNHVSFGTVLGEDGKPFKTRSGDTVGLESLLDEGVRKALAVVSKNDDEKPNGPEFSAEDRQRIAEAIGIAALKYADLSQHRTSDYIFSFDKMLALDGNTATYMQYSYARVQGIFRRGQVDPQKLRDAGRTIQLTHPAERALAITLLRFTEALEETLFEYRPNQLTIYLYELTKKFSGFFEACSVLKAESEELRDSRLLLCDLTGRVVRQGLALLGIEVVDRM